MLQVWENYYFKGQKYNLEHTHTHTRKHTHTTIFKVRIWHVANMFRGMDKDLIPQLPLDFSADINDSPK